MKVPIIFSGLTLLFALGRVGAQTNDKKVAIIKTYEFGASVPVQECALVTGKSKSGDTIIDAPKGAKFAYLGDVTANDRTRIIFQFLDWQLGTEKNARFNVQLSDDAVASIKSQALTGPPRSISDSDVLRTRTFCVDKEIFDKTASEVFAKWSLDLAEGILILPIKLRGGGGRDFDFSKDVTLGTVAGPRIRLSSERDLFASLLVGAGISAVTLSKENTHGVVSETTDRAAVTITTGLMIELNRFQLGVMTGWDHISNPNQRDWEYQGHRWLSIGLGYSLLSAPPSKPAGSQ